MQRIAGALGVTRAAFNYHYASKQDLLRALAERSLSYQVPPAVAGAAEQLGDMLDQADAYCRRGHHLLTLATPPEELRFRRWFISEIVEQVDGALPTPWPLYSGGAEPPPA